MFLRLVTCSPRSLCKPLKHDATDGKFGGFRSCAIISRVQLSVMPVRVYIMSPMPYINITSPSHKPHSAWQLHIPGCGRS